jgi:hypothetical protein
MPALLPDGTPSELSVSPVLTRRELGTGTTPAMEGLPAGGGPRGSEQEGSQPGGEQQPESGRPESGQPGDGGTERPAQTSTQGRPDL